MAIWPAGGIGLAALLFNPRRLWPAIIFVLFVAGNTADLIQHRLLLDSLGFMTANVMESLGCAWLITRICGNDVKFDQVKDILALVGAAIFVNACSACIGAIVASNVSGTEFFHSWLIWWVADGLGILLITPVIVLCCDPTLRSIDWQWGHAGEWAGFIAIWCMVSSIVFDYGIFPGGHFLFPYMLLALISWPAIRFGLRGVLTAMILLAVIMIASPDVQNGVLFRWGGKTFEDRLLLAQLYLGFTAILGMLFAAGYSERKHSQKLLRESEERLRLAANAAGFGVYNCNFKNGQMVYSPDFLALYGLPPDSMLELDQDLVPQALHPEDKADFLSSFTKANDPGGSGVLDTEYRVILPDASIRWLRVRGRTVFDQDNGQPLMANGIVQDITKRKQAEERIQKLAGEMQATLSTVSAGISYISDRKIVWANRAYDEMFGYAAGETQGMEVSLLYSDHANFEWIGQKAYSKLMEGETFSTELEMRKKDGTCFWCSVSGRAVNARQPAESSIWMVQDITERKHAADALRESKEHFSRFFHINPVGMALSRNSDDKFVDANSSFINIFGFTYDEIVGHTSQELGLWPCREQRDGAVAQVKVNGRAQGIEAKFRRKTGEIGDLLIFMEQVNLDGQDHLLSFVLDITRRKQDEEALRELNAHLEQRVAQRAGEVITQNTKLQEMYSELTHLSRVALLGQLSAALAHEINQPLGAILNNASSVKMILSRPQPDMAKVQKILSNIIEEDERAGNVIRKIRDLVKKESVDNESLDPKEIIGDVVQLIKTRSVLKDVALEVDIRSGSCWILGNKMQLQQVLLNLLTNALQALKEAPIKKLVIKSDVEEQGSVTVRVINSGPKIDMDQVENLFKPFYTTKKEGLGLGLFICRLIIQAHGGELLAYNDPALGVTFSFSLPLAENSGGGGK